MNQCYFDSAVQWLKSSDYLDSSFSCLVCPRTRSKPIIQSEIHHKYYFINTTLSLHSTNIRQSKLWLVMLPRGIMSLVSNDHGHSNWKQKWLCLWEWAFASHCLVKGLVFGEKREGERRGGRQRVRERERQRDNVKLWPVRTRTQRWTAPLARLSADRAVKIRDRWWRWWWRPLEGDQ